MAKIDADKKLAAKTACLQFMRMAFLPLKSVNRTILAEMRQRSCLQLDILMLTPGPSPEITLGWAFPGYSTTTQHCRSS